MALLALSDLSLHRPFRMRDGPSPNGPRLGGNSPAHPLEIEAALPSSAEYILTFPLSTEPDLYASVYQNCPADDFLEAQNMGFMTDDRIICLLHDNLPRGTGNRHCSSLSAHPIEILPVEPDLIPDGETGFVISSAHKFGGRPHCIQQPELPGAEELLQQGLLQILQIDFPSARDGNISGSWPFGDGLFNLFWKPTFHGETPQWCLQS